MHLFYLLYTNDCTLQKLDLHKLIAETKNFIKGGKS